MKLLKHTYFKSLKWGMLSIVVTFLNQILLIPALLNVFSKEIFAIWIILNTIVLLIRAINLGQLNYSSNVINLDGTRDHEKFRNNLDVAFNSNLIVIIIQFIVVLVLANKNVFTYLTDLEVSTFEFYRLGWCLVVLSVSKILYQFYNLYVLRLLEPFGKINYTIKYQVIGEFLDFFVILASCFLFRDLLLICISSLMISILYIVMVHKFVIMQEIKYYSSINKSGLNKGFFQIKNSRFLTLSFILEKFFEVGLNFVVTLTYSLTLVPIFNTTRVMANAAIKVSNIIVAPMMPSIQKSFTENNQAVIKSNLNNYWKFSLLFIIIIFSAILPFIGKLYEIWTQNKIQYDQYLFILILIAIILQNFNVVLVEMVKKTNQTKFILLMNFMKFCLIAGLFFYFGKIDFLYGLGFAVIIVEAFSVSVFLYYFRKEYFRLIISNLIINTILIMNLILFQFWENLWLFESVNFILILLILKNYVTRYIKRDRLH